jgi:hypothetical protein
MKISKYFYLYISLAILFVTFLFFNEKATKLFFIIITILFVVVLLYDFLNRNLVYRKPTLFNLSLDILVLIVQIYCLSNYFNLINIFVISFVVSFILKMFYVEKSQDIQR